MVAGPCKVARAARDCQEKNSGRETDSSQRVKHQVCSIFKSNPATSCGKYPRFTSYDTSNHMLTEISLVLRGVVYLRDIVGDI